MRRPPYSYKFYSTTAEAWEAMRQAITEANTSIYWEVYAFVDDAIGVTFVDLLAEKSKAGVEVKLVIDGVGSFNFSEEAGKKLTKAGVEVKIYNRLYPEFHIAKWFTRLLNRTHRKVLIVDQKVAFLGGVNIRDDHRTWNDIYVKIDGPVAWPLLRGFAKSYIAAGGKKEYVKQFLHPKLTELGKWREKFRFIAHSPTYKSIPKLRRMYLRALSTAKQTVNLITPYYVPDKQFLRAVAMARKRGVKVNIFMPLRTDIRLTELVARAYYRLTAKAGANIYLLPEMHHGKALTADDKIGIVGSANLTRRASHFDNESAVEFTDEQMVADLNKLFADLKEKAQLFDAERWEKRGVLNRMQEWVAKKLEDFV